MVDLRESANTIMVMHGRSLVSTAFSDRENNKIRSPAHAETDWIYCPEAPGSPRPQAVTAWKGLLDFISPLFITKYNVFATISFSFCAYT